MSYFSIVKKSSRLPLHIFLQTTVARKDSIKIETRISAPKSLRSRISGKSCSGSLIHMALCNGTLGNHMSEFGIQGYSEREAHDSDLELVALGCDNNQTISIGKSTGRKKMFMIFFIFRTQNAFYRF